MYRFGIGYAIAVVCGVAGGIALGIFSKAFAFINPVIQIIRPIAPVAWLPFIVLVFGIGDIPAIVIIFIAGFFPILLSTVSAVNSIDETYIKVASNFELTKWENVTKVIFPASFPQVLGKSFPPDRIMSTQAAWHGRRHAGSAARSPRRG